MAFNVEVFRNVMALDGARPNLFQVELIFPTWLQQEIASSQLRFLVNSTQLPQSTVGVARQHYFGREVKFPGDRVFPDWDVNVVNDENFVVRNALEAWSNALNNNVGNMRAVPAINKEFYSVDAKIIQFGKGGYPIKSYKMVGVFVNNIAPIQVAWNANDQIEEFGVTFSYQYWYDEVSTPIETSVYY